MSKKLGLIIFIVGLLALAHMNYLGDNPTIDGTLKETVDELGLLKIYNF